MSIVDATEVNIQEEGTEDVFDLEMVDKDFPKKLTDNLKRWMTRLMLAVRLLQHQLPSLAQSHRLDCKLPRILWDSTRQWKDPSPTPWCSGTQPSRTSRRSEEYWLRGRERMYQICQRSSRRSQLSSGRNILPIFYIGLMAKEGSHYPMSSVNWILCLVWHRQWRDGYHNTKSMVLWRRS